MDSDSWISSRLSNSSRRYYSRSDLFVGGNDDSEPGGDDLRAEYLCPFCAEDYDVVSLCCHIDEEHPLQANTGRKRRVRKGISNSTLFRKELREGALHSLLGGSSSTAYSNSEPDTLLSSFIFNPVVGDEAASEQSSSSIEAAIVKESSKDDFVERKPQQVQLSDEDRVEKARRFDFVQGLLMSTILDDNL
ncbi:hypothetical protein TSUD_393470 [Trifolium subterraneum]|uniref:Protein dehydration-induced 19 C-terminal domain-containing protein n=1 Tax=Trifolium subterraneum TaxID=3900 RepID=A0A2Z6NQG7_TRISU|nr:hypothetical protein TSUD_393470 [Trifolium subterraneum]